MNRALIKNLTVFFEIVIMQGSTLNVGGTV